MRKTMNLKVEFNDIHIEDNLRASAFRNVVSIKGKEVGSGSIQVSARKGFGDSVHYSCKVRIVIFLLSSSP